MFFVWLFFRLTFTFFFFFLVYNRDHILKIINTGKIITLNSNKIKNNEIYSKTQVY